MQHFSVGGDDEDNDNDDDDDNDDDTYSLITCH